MTCKNHFTNLQNQFPSIFRVEETTFIDESTIVNEIVESDLNNLLQADDLKFRMVAATKSAKMEKLNKAWF